MKVTFCTKSSDWGVAVITMLLRRVTVFLRYLDIGGLFALVEPRVDSTTEYHTCLDAICQHCKLTINLGQEWRMVRC